MDPIQRNERIFKQREQGGTYREIAALFGISPGRVRQICSREKRRFERRQLENPKQIVALGSQKILRIKNIGRKSLKELADALLRLGLIREGDGWLILPEYPRPKQGPPPFRRPVFK